MFKTRLLSGIVLVIIALVTIISGSYLLWGTLFLVSLIGLTELYRAAGVQEKGFSLLALTGALGVASYYLLLLFGFEAYSMMDMIFILIVLMAVYVFTYPKYHADQVMAAFFGVVYVSVMLSYIYQTRILPGGIFTVWLVFVCSWGCDTCAYCVGMLIGKHKMAPILSPKKSVEGGIGGIVGAALIGILYALAVNYWGNAGEDVLRYAIIGAAGGAISQIGDLAASAIKRYHNIKDYGKLIPGHGGILDRFDSVIFTAPIIYYLALFL